MTLVSASESLPSIRLGDLEAPRGRRLSTSSGGAAAAGCNNVIYTLADTCRNACVDLIGIYGGWDAFVASGLSDDTRIIRYSDIEPDALERMLADQPGNKWGTTRMMPHRQDFHLALEIRRRLGIEWHIVVGGDGSAGAAHPYTYISHPERPGESLLPMNAVGKTMDNDLNGNFMTFGYSTAREIAAQSLAAMVGEVQTKWGVRVVELMGRDSGRLTAEAAAIIDKNIICLIPEVQITREHFLEIVAQRKRETQTETCKEWYAVIAVGEWFRFVWEKQCTTWIVDAAGNPQLADVTWKIIGPLLTSQGYNIGRIQKPAEVVRSATPNQHDKEITALLAHTAAQLSIDHVWWYGVGLDLDSYDEKSIKLNVVARPLHTIRTGNFVNEWEYDVHALRLKPPYITRAHVSHFSELKLRVPHIDEDHLRAQHIEVLRRVAAERDQASCGGGGLAIPRRVIDFEREKGNPEKNEPPGEYPTLWSPYIEELMQQ